MRGRELKLEMMIVLILTDFVAPYAGAWIETGDWKAPENDLYVAPYAGAWIETIVHQPYASLFL